MIKFIRLIISLVIILAILGSIFYFAFQPAANPIWGVSFSVGEAKYLGLDPKQVYIQILDDLKPERIRLMAYWENLEPEQGQFVFSDIDFFLSEAAKHGTKVLLVLGHKQPRWPECHHPDWYEKLDDSEKSTAVLTMLEQSVEHFKNFSAVYSWQIENEAFFPYGPEGCGLVGSKLFDQEINLVKSLDSRPIVVTDSGEKGAWINVAWAGGDVFGSTMYRTVYHGKKQKYITYPIPPALYRLKAGMVRMLSGVDQFIGVELQAEPWFQQDIRDTTWETQSSLMNPDIFQKNVDYARQVGFAENYFWGVEWWYWARFHGHPEMWEAAKKILNH